MFEACRTQGQCMTKEVVADDLQRHQAELGIEHRQGRVLPIIAGAEPDVLAVIVQVQFEECSQ
ncbi:hypothetical protein D3C76_1823090 [compost metagenome]